MQNGELRTGALSAPPPIMAWQIVNIGQRPALREALCCRCRFARGYLSVRSVILRYLPSGGKYFKKLVVTRLSEFVSEIKGTNVRNVAVYALLKYPFQTSTSVAYR